MRALRPTPSLARRALPALVVFSTTLAAAGLAPHVHAHGGNTLMEGSKSGVTFRVQTAPSTTPNGAPAIDLSTILGGPGTGEATVDYWVRPAGRKAAFKVQTQRDAGGTYHSEIPTSDRGDANRWDLSAIVTVAGGTRLRVTNAPEDPPGPDPTDPGTTPSPEDAPSSEGPTTPTLTEGPSTPADPLRATPPGDGAKVDDISGKEDGPPGWAFPSLLVLTVIGLAILAVKRRRPPMGD